MKPPFDFFGVNAKFFVDGRNRTLTWIGCLCTTILVGTIVTLFVFQAIAHTNKVESLVTTYKSDSQKHHFFDM